MNNPLISILIPNYNKAPYIRETLNSVLAQTYANWECIIVDDHSTDYSWDILIEFAEIDTRCKIYKRPKHLYKGANSCRNFALELSKGEFIQYLDSDDTIHTAKLELQVFSLNDKSTVSISDWSFFGNFHSNRLLQQYRLESIPKSPINLLTTMWTHQKFIPSFCYLIPRGLIKNSWKNNLIKNQDGHFFFNLLIKNPNLIFVSRAVGFYRLPENNHVSRNQSLCGFRSELMVLFHYEMILNISNSVNILSGLVNNYLNFMDRCIDKFPALAKLAWKRIVTLNPKLDLVSKKKLFYRLLIIFGFDLSFYFRKKLLLKVS